MRTTPTLKIGAWVTHPSLPHPLEVYKRHYTHLPLITGCRQLAKPKLWSGKVYCKYRDEQGVEHRNYLFLETELTVID